MADLLKKLQRQLMAMGKYTISGRVPAAWYEQQKESGFMKIGQQSENMQLSERRILSITDFCVYAGGIDKELASKFAKETGSVVRIGRRVLVDRWQLYTDVCKRIRKNYGKERCTNNPTSLQDIENNCISKQIKKDKKRQRHNREKNSEL